MPLPDSTSDRHKQAFKESSAGQICRTVCDLDLNLQEPYKVAASIPFELWPTSSVDKMVPLILSSTAFRFTYLFENVRQFIIDVTGVPGTFQWVLSECNAWLLEDGSFLLQENGDSLLVI